MENKRILDGQYEIVSEIKSGGFATVYYGIDRNLGKPVALKEIRAELLQEAKYIDLFQAEAQNAAQLSHQNIAHIYELRRAQDGRFYIIMEYVDGVDLTSMLRRAQKLGQPMAPEVACFIIVEICKALDYAFNRRDMFTNQPLHLVHQDISPSNIMISVNGQVKLIDFGIAKVRMQQISESKGGIVVQGKLPYMAPEQLRTPASDPDRRSDIYALGAVFFELLTGARLYNQSGPEDLVAAIRRARPNLDPLQDKNVPGELQKIVMKAINTDIDRRYQSAYHMNLELTDYLTVHNGTYEFEMELSDYIKLLFLDDKSNGNGANPRVPVEQEPVPVIEPEKTVPVVELGDDNYLPLETNFDDDLSNLADLGDLDNLKDLAVVEEPATVATPVTIPTETVAAKSDSHEKNQSLMLETDYYSEPEPVATVPDIDESLKTHTPLAVTHAQRDEEVGEDEMKTIIDVVRLQARTHKKAIIFSLVGVVGAFLLFTLLDILLQLTAYGQGLYDFISPPAIKIVSVPPGAEVILDNHESSLKTPASVRRITPGVHKLTLRLAGFKSIEKSIQVPPKGKLSVAGMSSPPRREPYLFRFESMIEFNTTPQGATVYLNGSPYTEITPCRVPWKVGVPIEVEMRKEGFAPITGFSVNLLDEVEQVDDRRVWNFMKVLENEKSYVINATFRKGVNIGSVPDGAEVYVGNDPNPIGLTGIDRNILLPIGRHEIILRKEGFIEKRIYLDVNEKSPTEISEVLYRMVTFYAKDVTDPGDNELGARIVELVRNGQVTRRDDQTPCKISLPAHSYEVLIQKQGYKDVYVTVTPTTNEVIARMEPLNVYVEISVIDALSGAPLQGVQLSFRDPTAGENESYFGQTDQAGRVGKDLVPGRYTFKAKKFGYQEAVKNFSTKLREANNLNFRLVLQ